MFTTENTLNEIIEGVSEGKMKAYYSLAMPMEFFDLIPEEMRDSSLAEIRQKFTMPWGMPYPSEDVAKAANFAADMVRGGKYGIHPLWENDRDDFIPDLDEKGKKSVFLLTLEKNQTDQGEQKPVVIICPGGGYETLSMVGEGVSMAERFEEAGYFPFVLCYRLSPNRYPDPQKDLALAIKYVRDGAQRFHIDPDRLMLTGSSAGGHLCASLAALYPEIDEELMKELAETFPEAAEKYKGISVRPDQLCLNYPVISFAEEAHEGSFQALTGGNEELRDKLSVEKHVPDDFPKTFVWACEDDELVPVSNAKRLGKVMQEKGLPCDLEIYPTGGHGCGLAAGTSADGWFDEMIHFFQQE